MRVDNETELSSRVSGDILDAVDINDALESLRVWKRRESLEPAFPVHALEAERAAQLLSRHHFFDFLCARSAIGANLRDFHFVTTGVDRFVKVDAKRLRVEFNLRRGDRRIGIHCQRQALLSAALF